MPLRIPRTDPAPAPEPPAAAAPLAAAPLAASRPAGVEALVSRRRDSGRPLLHLADRIFGKPLCITRTKCETILGVLGPRLGLAADAIPPVLVQMDDEEEDDPGYAVENGIACIPVRGTLVKRAGGLRAMSGLPSYESLKQEIGQALADAEVKGICLDVDSPGGEASGCADMADWLYSQRGTKPIYAVCNDQMCSAAYWIASAADQIYTTRDGMLGSIGCYMLHIDQSGYDEQRGLKYTYIQAGAKKTEGNAHEPLSDSAEETLKTEVTRIRDMFAQCVARNRNCPVSDLLDLEADVRFAEAAIPLLADQLGTCADAMRDLRAQLGIPEQPDEEEEENDDDEQDENEQEALAYDAFSECAQAQALAREFHLPLIEVRLTEESAAALAPRIPQLNATRAKHGLPPLFTDPRFAHLIGAGERHAAAIPPHKTATVDQSWDGPANEARLKLNRNAAYYRKAYAWQEDGSDGTKKNQFKFIHHEVAGSGAPQAANVQGCRSGIEVLNGARGGTTIPRKDRQGTYDHLAKHMRDAGAEPPELKSAAQLEAEGFVAALSIQEQLGFGSIQQLFVSACKPGASGWVDVKGIAGDARLLAVRCFGRSHIAAAASAEAPIAENSRHIVCCVAPYNQLSQDLGGFKEMYQPGCFHDWLESGEDARALWYHDPKYVLGRRSVGTARFYEQADGLYFECEAPATGWANDLLVSMRRGDVSGGSAAFFILRPRWEYQNGTKVRVIETARLVEGSVASFPIYEGSRARVQPATARQSAAADAPTTSLELCEARLRLLKLR